MKSRTFQSISTLILGLSTLAGSFGMVSQASAMDITTSAVDPSLLPTGTEINGKRYWSVAEMQIASDLINAKREEFCQGDRMCKEELPWQQMDELGGIYRALDPYENIHFMLTSINPSANTVKFLYHDEDKMLSRMLGETIRHDIASIYAVWVDESLGSITTTSSNWLAYGQRAPYHLGTAEEVEAATHLIFDESEAELGAGWFTPNVEREYRVEGSNLADNTTSQIYFSFNATEGGGHSHGTLNYSNCTKSPEYTAGMECKAMFSEDGSYTHLPFVATSTPTENPTGPSNPTDPSSPTDQPDNPTNPSDINPTESGDPTDSIATEPDTPTNSDITPTPTDTETTTPSNPTNQPSTEITNEPTVSERIIYVTVKDSTHPTQTVAKVESTSTPIYSDTRANHSTTSPNETISAESDHDKKDSMNCSDSKDTSTVEIPLAATPTSTDEEHVFPWWLVAFMFFGSAFIIFSWWFLLPLFKKKDDDREEQPQLTTQRTDLKDFSKNLQKNRTKFEKTLDKIIEVR